MNGIYKNYWGIKSKGKMQNVYCIWWSDCDMISNKQLKPILTDYLLWVEN